MHLIATFDRGRSWIFICVCGRIKKGGPNPVSNLTLAALIEKSKDLDIPRDIVDRNIKKASEKGQESYVEKFYEVVCCTTCCSCFSR